MSDHARVESIQAIAEFRTALLVYISKIRPLLDDAADEVFRTREWLRVDQRVHWENEFRKRSRQLSDAQQAQFSAEISNLRDPSSAEINAAHQARRALAHSEEKLRLIKRLAGNFEKESMPRVKQIDSLRALVGTDLVAASHFLDRVISSLERYTATTSVASTPPPAPVENPGETS